MNHVLRRILFSSIFIIAIGCGGESSGDGPAGPSDAGDDNDVSQACSDGQTRACSTGSQASECATGQQACEGGTWGECVETSSPPEEVCDGVDNDCDGVIDEGCPVGQLASSRTHGCLIEEGQLYCWGSNDRGQLGIGEDVDGPFPITRVGDSEEWSRVDSFEELSCGIKGGQAYCWGKNNEDATGSPGDLSVLEPSLVTEDGTWTEIAPGNFFACGIRNGELWCWGNADVTDPLSENRPPTRIGTRSDWTSLDAGRATVCGVAGGQVFCWGNSFGGDESNPRLIGDASDWHRITVNWDNSGCGIKIGGTVSCWRCTTGDDCPVEVETVVEASGFWSLDAESKRACAVDREGELWCWGNNYGNNLLGAESAAEEVPPTRIWPDRSFEKIGVGSRMCANSAGELLCWGAFDPNLFDGDPDPMAFTQITEQHEWSTFDFFRSTCAVADGDLYCWGAAGTLGLNLEPVTVAERPTLVDDSRAWSHVSMDNISACGIADERLLCWGAHRSWGGEYDSPPSEFDSETGWSAVDSDSGEYCGIRNGSLLCWTDRSTDIEQIGEQSDWTSVSMGDNYGCGIRGGELYCWGDNDSGQLGIGTSQDAAQPTQVGSEADWDSVYAGGSATCGLRGQTLLCWGDEYRIGRSSDALEPFVVAEGVVAATAPHRTHNICYATASAIICDGEDFAAISADALHAKRENVCALSGGDIHCAGGNEGFRFGFLGNPEPNIWALP